MIKEPLVIEHISLSIEPESRKYLTNVSIFDSIPSTNTWLLEKAKKGAPSGSICLAEEQTHGRGRLGKKWYSPPGTNIYCSLLWHFGDIIQDLAGLGIAVGVMVMNALQQYGIQAGLTLKWPNDILAMNRKLSGILLERTGQSQVVIGVGLNLDVQLAQEKNWIDISELTGQPARRNYLTGLLLNEMLKKLPQFERQGLAPFLPEWKKHDGLLDKDILIVTPEKNISGIMRGISESGELLLENENGLSRFRYGEVSVITNAGRAR